MLAATRYKHSLPSFCLSQSTDKTVRPEKPHSSFKQEQFESLFKQYKRRQEAAYFKTLIKTDRFEDFIAGSVHE